MIQAPVAICIREGERSPRKVTKVIAYKSGGFAIMAPYHSARVGHVLKVPVDYRQTDAEAHLIEHATRYSAEDRVKLSYHPDGFVQFSSERSRSIRSGRDPDTGEIKGVGVMTNPLWRPITSGPTCGVQVWGLDEFQPARKRDLESALVFGEDDFYYGPGGSPEDWNSYVVEFFVFTPHFAPHVQVERGVLPLWFQGYNNNQGAFFDFRLIGLKQAVALGVICRRLKTGWQVPSGFILGGPAEANALPIKMGIQARYPLFPEDANQDASSLSYEPARQ